MKRRVHMGKIRVMLVDDDRLAIEYMRRRGGTWI